MFFNISYTNPETTEEINRLVGPPFSFLKRLSMGSIGSQRFTVVDADSELSMQVPFEERSVFCNIGLRPKGLKIWISVKLHTFLLALPYEGLRLNHDNHVLEFTNEAHRLRLLPAHNAALNLSFVKKIRSLMES